MTENKRWWDKIRWLSVVEKIAILTLFSVFTFTIKPWWPPISSDPLLQFITLSFLLLIIALVTIWVFGIPLTNTNEIDLEYVACERIKATITILAMLTILGVASLITYGVTHTNSDVKNKKTEPPPPTSVSPSEALSCIELDRTLKQTVTPLVAQFNTITQRLDRLHDKVEPPPPTNVSCREFEALLSMSRISGGISGSTSLMDLIGKGLDFGDNLLQTGVETEEAFLDGFLVKFTNEFGTELGKGAGQAVFELGKVIYKKLTAKDQKVWVVQFDTIGSLTSLKLEKVIDEMEEHGINAGCSFNISGHTDTLGTDSKNYELSEKRAEEVASKIKAKFQSALVHMQGWGERRLHTKTNDNKSHIDNRRVEIEATCLGFR